MNRERLIPWMRLMGTPGIGPATARRLVDALGGPAAALSASPDRLKADARATPKLIRALQNAPPAARSADELDRLETMGATALCLDDPAYPPLLKEIHDPPPVLYIQGDPAYLTETAVAIVGTRDASRRGHRAARALGRDLAAAGVVVVSGLARGIDAAAHLGALEGGGAGIAVLGPGLDIDYPKKNRELRERLVRQGCLVTAAPLGTPPTKGLFPPRNRIISGLCDGICVMEAGGRSGSLITARMALEQGREVFAAPPPGGDPDDSRAAGPNRLIEEGAGLATSAREILEALGLSPAAVAAPTRPSPEPAPSPKPSPEPIDAGLPALAQTLLTTLAEGPLSGDEITRMSGLTVAEVSSILLQLELAGLVERQPGNLFIKL